MWTWQAKVFESLFQQLKYKLESLLAVDFLGTDQMYIISQCIPSSDIREPDTKASTGQDQTSGSKWVCYAESCWLVIWWRLSWYRRCLIIPIHIFFWNLLSSPLPTRERDDLPFLLPVSFMTAGLVWNWTSLPDRVWTGVTSSDPAYREPVIHLVGKVCVQHTITGLNPKSSVKMG